MMIMILNPKLMPLKTRTSASAIPSNGHAGSGLKSTLPEGTKLGKVDLYTIAVFVYYTNRNYESFKLKCLHKNFTLQPMKTYTTLNLSMVKMQRLFLLQMKLQFSSLHRSESSQNLNIFFTFS